MKADQLLLVVKARRLAASGEARRLRLSADLSIREVADAIGASVSALWRWENGQRAPHGQAAAAWGALLKDLARERDAHDRAHA